MYLHQQPDWPDLRWQAEVLIHRLAGVRHRQGQLLGRMANLGFDLSTEAVRDTLTEEAVKSSEIEEEILNPDQVRSSVARHLGLEAAGLPHPDRTVEGIVELMLDATQGQAQPLTRDRLFDWHASLFPTGRSGLKRITVGGWRDAGSDPIQVVSGPIGRERVHFEAPAAARIDGEMQEFLDWFNAPSGADGVLRAGIAHLWFVTIHPFEDGNGRLARAITDMALCRAENSPQRFYSMSSQIRRELAEYHRVLERTQRGATDVTQWLTWFLGCLGRAMESSEDPWPQPSPRAGSGSEWPTFRSMSGSARCSTGC
jgi:Fic family protein